MNIFLLYFAIKYKGDWDLIYKAVDQAEKVPMEELQKVRKQIEKEDWKFKTIIDVDYPKKLKEAFKPPFVIWYKGDIKLLEKRNICLTGNDVDKITEERIKVNVAEVEKNHNIIALDFKGVDEEVRKESKTSKIYVLPEGINKEYKDNNLYISEYPPGTHPKKDYFRNRNRIIASFASDLVLFSSIKNGKINHLISSFLNMGKDIHCFTGKGDENDGNSALIQQGANLITSIRDIN